MRRAIKSRPLVYITYVATIVLFGGSTSSYAGNAACWGDDTRKDITCVKVTEPLLLSLRGQSVKSVRKVLGADGRDLGTQFHFLSNYDRGRTTGAGAINVTFENDRATIVHGSEDTPDQAGEFAFVWSAYAVPILGDEFDKSIKDFLRPPFCSDFSDSSISCSGHSRSLDHELTMTQVMFGLTKAEVLDELERACNPGQGLVVDDVAGDCDRVRRRFR